MNRILRFFKDMCHAFQGFGQEDIEVTKKKKGGKDE